jgi:hypothetical protein
LILQEVRPVDLVQGMEKRMKRASQGLPFVRRFVRG